MLGIEEGWVYPYGQPVADPFGCADQLEAEPELVGVFHVIGGYLADTLVAHLVEPHRGVKSQPRDDRHLRSCIAPVDVVGRVGLGVAKLLGLGQCFLEADPAASPFRSE